MKINAEFDKTVAVHSQEIDWVPSPMPGVDRRMLDRVGGEVARATSLVRYAEGSHFSAHTHSGGEEFIVLEGTFQDEHGDYPPGTYVRNPIGTQHVPRADKGCTIFVKLWQFEANDQDQFALDLNTTELSPLDGHPGISQAVLHQVPSETVLLEQWAPNAQRKLADEAGAELLVLGGDVYWQGESYQKHDWVRLAPSDVGEFRAGASGAKLWLKTGHLAKIAREGWQSPPAG